MNLTTEEERRALSCLRSDGLFISPAPLPTALLAPLRGEVEAMLASPGDGIEAEDNPGGPSVRLWMDRIEPTAVPVTVAVLRAAALERISRAYLPGCTFCVDAVAARNVRSAAAYVHFDVRRALKCMIYLNDVDRGNAAFRYAPGTHRANAAQRTAHLRSGGAVEDLLNVAAPGDRCELLDVEGPAGTVILFDTEGFHAAGSLSPGRERFLLRSRSTLRHPLEARIVRRLLRSRLNPFRLLPPRLPEGRQRTRGQARPVSEARATAKHSR